MLKTVKYYKHYFAKKSQLLTLTRSNSKQNSGRMTKIYLNLIQIKKISPWKPSSTDPVARHQCHKLEPGHLF